MTFSNQLRLRVLLCTLIMVLGPAYYAPKAAEGEEFRIWTSVDGEKARLAFIEMKAGNIRFRQTDGKVVNVPIDRLSSHDRKWLDEHPGDTKDTVDEAEDASVIVQVHPSFDMDLAREKIKCNRSTTFVAAGDVKADVKADWLVVLSVTRTEMENFNDSYQTMHAGVEYRVYGRRLPTGKRELLESDTVRESEMIFVQARLRGPTRPLVGVDPRNISLKEKELRNKALERALPEVNRLLADALGARGEDSGEAEPTATSARTWTDRTKRFTVTAEFVRMNNDKVFLRKSDGLIISVPLDELSRLDRDFVRASTGGAKDAGSDLPAKGSQ